MRTLTTTALAVTLTVAGLVTVAGQEPASRLALNIMALSTTTDVSELRLLDARVDALVRTNALVLASRQPDVSLSGRVHETFQQYHAGVPVYGGGISRQLANTGLTVSIFGTIYQEIDLDMTPQLAQHEALALVEQRAGAGPATDDPLTLVIVPTPFDTYVLAYRATMRDFRTYFLDAHSGAIVHVENEVDEQGAIVGIGVGVNNDRKKVSASPAGGGFQTYDRLRPAERSSRSICATPTHAWTACSIRGAHGGWRATSRGTLITTGATQRWSARMSMGASPTTTSSRSRGGAA